MAAEASVNIAPPECSSVLGTTSDSFSWPPDSGSMHVIRPKSAKGRTRPHPRQPQGTGTGPQRSPVSSISAASLEPSGSQKPGACKPRSPHRGSPEDVPELRQQMPLVGGSSLNRYPVLPSISRKALEEQALGAGTSSLQPSSAQAQGEETGNRDSRDTRAQRRWSPERPRPTQQQSPPEVRDLEEPSDQEPRLLLAVRSPSGRRFVRHFRPTDALQTVVAEAERRNETAYPHCSLETMEVPRRCFSDLTKSLQDCQIPHKSVLGISQCRGSSRP